MWQPTGSMGEYNMAKDRCPKHGIVIPDWGSCPLCSKTERDWNRYDDSFGFRKKKLPTQMGVEWKDKKGVSHGDWCRLEFYQTKCNYCQQESWYFECKHGSKVFFHDVPWEGGAWDAECPKRKRY
jgi:hypothetical protein